VADLYAARNGLDTGAFEGGDGVLQPAVGVQLGQVLLLQDAVSIRNVQDALDDLRECIATRDAMEEAKRITEVTLAGGVGADLERRRAQREFGVLEVLEALEA